jgi:hypothetical protein
MTDADSQCYKDRYADVTGESQTDIKNQYTSVGKSQGRLNTCASNITDYQAEFVWSRAPALQKLYGYDLEKVRANYTSLGSNASSTYDVTTGVGQIAPRTCGEDMPDTDFNKHKCGCDGTIYYGLGRDLISGI